MIPDFWAKTTLDGEPGISVFNHMGNVGYVALKLAEQRGVLLNFFELDTSVVAVLAGLHDIGKITIGFQRKCQKWVEKYPELKLGNSSLDSFNKNHSQTGQYILNHFLVYKGVSHKAAKYISAAIAAHHGKIIAKPVEIEQTKFLFDETLSGIDWPKLRQKDANKIWSLFNADVIKISNFDSKNAGLWWLAGLTTIADWIASNEDYFSASRDQSSVDGSKQAQFSIKNVGLNPVNINKDLSFHDLFHDKENPAKKWQANDMQKKVKKLITEPGVYLIEAPMGLGKTEAALWAAYTLLCEGRASGIYFALPTQVTSNRIFLRFNQFVERIVTSFSKPQLIHSNSWLMDNDLKTPHLSRKNTDAKNWFSSSKRAILAPFGVGPIDQALLGVVPAKHFFVRHFALAGKIIILDEVHSYDIYTGTLIDTLVDTLEKIGCTIIILSATLSKKRRETLVKISEKHQHLEMKYPLISRHHTKGGKDIPPVAPQMNVSGELTTVLNKKRGYKWTFQGSNFS